VSGGPGLAFVSRPVLETPRLRLRLPEERDLDALAAMYSDGTTMRHIGSTVELPGTSALVHANAPD
jgi:RimJ/RimL family protein N-acetyltransferase